MTTITIVKRFLAQSPEEILTSFRSYFALIDHGQRISDIEAKIESIKRIYDPQTNKIIKGFADEFNRTILGLWEEVYKANGQQYNSQTTFQFMLKTDDVAYTTCNTVNNAVNSYVANYANPNYAGSYKTDLINAAKRFMQYYNSTGVASIVTYQSQLNQIAKLDDNFMYQDAFKNYNMQSYVRELDAIDANNCFNNMNVYKSRRYEYVMMSTINEIADLCKCWAKRYKIEMNCPNNDIVKTIYALAHSSTYCNDNKKFGYWFTQYFTLDGNRTNKDDKNMHCHILIIAYDQKEGKFVFKYVN